MLKPGSWFCACLWEPHFCPFPYGSESRPPQLGDEVLHEAVTPCHFRWTPLRTKWEDQHPRHKTDTNYFRKFTIQPDHGLKSKTSISHPWDNQGNYSLAPLNRIISHIGAGFAGLRVKPWLNLFGMETVWGQTSPPHVVGTNIHLVACGHFQLSSLDIKRKKTWMRVWNWTDSACHTVDL